MFEPVTITSSMVMPGWPVVCGVGTSSCATVIRTGQKQAAMIARQRPLTGSFIAGRSCRAITYNLGNRSSYLQTSVVLKIHRQTTVIFVMFAPANPSCGGSSAAETSLTIFFVKTE
jgi:hypothetical protein